MLHCSINNIAVRKETIMWPYTESELAFINGKESPMFNNADEFIDTVQKAKKDWVKMFVYSDNVSKTMNEFIDAQTTYTKEAVKATSAAAGTIASEIQKTADQIYSGKHFKKMQEQVSNDLYSTFWKEAFKYYTPSYK